MRKNSKKIVLSKETLRSLTNLDSVVGGTPMPPTNFQYICNTIQPCTGDCATGPQMCRTQAVTWCDLVSANC
jgi:hypothetical protein